jgi:hypothetical protein
MASMTIAGPAPGWKTTTHKRYTSKDRLLLKQLETALRPGGPEQSSTHHFRISLPFNSMLVTQK